ncbi:adenylate kinase isoenzyme 6-like [Bolinopsis microptera]|uniref:adenylate kinase isoenzyme 6-like n=1 Tax=Bolinopsis microptera TaxID=2820187 RepID=UPI00307AF09C
MSETRKHPNILITGTPGTGKTKLATRLAELTNMKHINIGKVAEENECYDGYDENLACKVLDEDKILNCIESDMSKGNNIVDYHGSDFFDEDWFDIVFVLRAEIEVLNKRLEERGYNEDKIKNNLESEIFQVLLEEAWDSYDPDIVQQLTSNNLADVDTNLQSVTSWIKSWHTDNDTDVDR